MRIRIIIPKYERKVHDVVLELASYFGINNVDFKVRKTPNNKYYILVNGSVFAESTSLEGVRIRFWRNWKLLKKYGYIPSRK